MVTNQKFIVIDGIDGCGKSTQLSLLKSALERRCQNTICLSFPDYDSHIGRCIRDDYLEQSYHDDNDKSRVYGSSLLYASDRYISFHKKWKQYYNYGYNIITARYTTSNIIHQMAVLPSEEWDNYISWITDLEYNKMRLPEPTSVILLRLPITEAIIRLDKRYQETGGHKDLHESNVDYLARCASAADYAAKKLNWTIVNCLGTDGQDRPMEAIHEEIIQKINI